MKYEVGETVSHYRIIGQIGQGGMGVVYKAQDLKLDRTVALKFLPPELTLDPDAKERFVHEAKAASSLQHHNICTIHDIDQTDDGQMFIVMDLYEGETLKSRIAKGELRIEEALDIAAQVAQGLAKAHESGIVHRDIKPANIMVGKDGIVKIVDFGLAKLSGRTLLTKSGTTLGTAAYMSPEQAKGEQVDQRTDIWSLGVVLYEMLTGKTPFRGDHEAALMYSILSEEPEPLQTHIPDVTSELIHVVSRALEKDPSNRYKTMDDLLIDLRRVRKETSKVSMPTFGGKKVSLFTRSRIVMFSSAIVFASIAIALFLLNQPRRLPQLNPGGKANVVPLLVKMVLWASLSHDGNWIAFSGADESENWDIYYMNPSGGAINRVTYDSSFIAAAHDCSKDGAWILFVRQRRADDKPEIAIVPSMSGRVQTVTNGSFPQFWPMSNKILYQRVGGSGVPSDSGKFEICSINIDGTDNRVVFVDRGRSIGAGTTSIPFWPSPDGKSIGCIKTFPDFSQDIITCNLETGKESQVTFSRTPKSRVFWTRDNYLIYSSYANGNFDLWICPMEGGAEQQLTRSRHDEMWSALCDDGSRLLYFERNYPGNIKSIDLTTGAVSSITADDQTRIGLCVSPDKRYAAYTTSLGWLTRLGIQIIDTKKEYPPRTILAEERIGSELAWSPDGKWIAYRRNPDSVGGINKICVVSPFAGTRPKIVAEVKAPPDAGVYLRWVNRDTLSWYSEMKTWTCGVENQKPRQFFLDSTRARLIQGQKYVLFRDYRVGRQGWWIVASPLSAVGREGAPKKISGTEVRAVSPDGEFVLYSQKAGELFRIDLPDGKTTRLSYGLPLQNAFARVDQDLKTVMYVEVVSNSKLMLWENPFIKE